MRDFTKRLAKLEAGLAGNDAAPLPGGSFSLALFQSAVLAVHRGAYQDGEAIASAHAWALGYASAAEYRAAITSGDWLERHNTIWAAFCDECGVGPDVMDEVKDRFLDYMIQTVPEHVRRGLWLTDSADLHL